VYYRGEQSSPASRPAHQPAGLAFFKRWIDADPSEPALSLLPSQLWLIGLGHFGQAYLWALGLLP